MKQVILIIGMTLIALCSKAQDTIVMTDGSKVSVQIISESSEEVRYKNWTNLSGPTWVKSKQNIQTIKRAKRIAIKSDEVLDFSDCSSDIPNTECISGNEIVGQIDDLYNKRGLLETIKKELSEYVSALPSCIQRKCVYKYYLNRFEHSKEMGVVEYILQDGGTYLLLGGEEQLDEVVEDLVLLYAAEGKEEEAAWWMNFFTGYSESNDNLFAEEIEQLSIRKEELLHPYRWEDEIKGKWVLLGRVSNKGNYSTDEPTIECPLILDVQDVRISTGAYMVAPNQSVPRLRKQKTPFSIYKEPINKSQSIFFNGELNYSLFQFASMNISDGRWKTQMAHTIVDYSRETSAEIIDYITNLNISPEDILYKGLAVAATASVIELMASNMNTSSKTDQVYTIMTYPNKPDVMNAFVSHVSATTITPSDATQNVRTVYNEYIKEKKSYMVRWEDSDSICFVSGNGNPITLHPVDEKDPVLDEYRRIKFNHSILSPRVFLPLLGCDALAVVSFIHGRKLDDMSFARDEHGNKIPNGLGGYVFDENLAHKGFYFMYGGALGFMIANMAILKIAHNHRYKAYDELNLRNMEKLRRKASAQLSMSPTYYPEANALGANINLSF